jgi:sugar phosphate permease
LRIRTRSPRQIHHNNIIRGTKGYYGSFAETAINVEDAPTATEQPIVEEKQSKADMYFIPAVIAIIVAIAIATVLILRKKP